MPKPDLDAMFVNCHAENKKRHVALEKIANASRIPNGADDPYSALETVCEALVEAGYLTSDYHHVIVRTPGDGYVS